MRKATPFDAVNYGQGGFVIWQEVELLERLLTTGHVPDVAVFYNGANEISTQVSELSDSPSYTQAATARRLLQPKSAASAVYDAYVRYSVIHKLRNRLRGAPPRPATPSSALTEARAHNAVVLHARAVAFIEKLAAAYGFRPLFFWQPTVFDKEIGEGPVMAIAETNDEDWGCAYRAATAQVVQPVVDLTDALDSVSGPVFFDRVHTNELGAGVVADAMYQAIIDALVPV